MTGFEVDAPGGTRAEGSRRGGGPAATFGPAPREGSDLGSAPAGRARPSAPEPAVPSGLAALRDEARLAGERLGTQPLPIVNHDAPLLQKLFGG